ncbi:MAG: hypothetical protein LW825_05640 [Candidatus Jidaibacter sp.]|nr:hypothetical protein [Candidatus Jidaibacter sp.]
MLLKSFKHNTEGKALAVGDKKFVYAGAMHQTIYKFFEPALRLTTSAGGELLQLYQKGNLPHQN